MNNLLGPCYRQALDQTTLISAFPILASSPDPSGASKM